MRLWRRVRRVALRAWFRESFLGFGVWFVPGEVLVEGCDECCELVAGEPGCTMVSQRSFPVWFEYITGVLSSFLPSVGPLSLGGGVLGFTPYE